MIPILFAPTATEFSSFGIGHLPDAISPHVVEERNGEFTFEMQYPIDGEHFDDIRMRSIILAKPNPQQNPQPFRVYRITKPINGIVTVFANHLRYDLAGVPVAPFTASSLYNALNAMVSNRLVQSPFTFTTDKWSDTDMISKVPTSTLALMGGQQGSLLDIYGGEYLTDGYQISLLTARGRDNGVVIRYGVDLIDMEQEENCANCYTGVLCFWQSMDTNQLVSGTIQSAGTFDYTRILVVDRSGNYEEAPTVERLNLDAVNYINTNKVGIPKVSLTVRFANLEQTEEYANIRQSLALCDWVTVEFEKLGVSAFAKVIRTDYDVLLERYISVDIGESRSSLADTIIGLSTFSESVPTITEMQQAIDATTAAITGADGGAVRLLDTNADGEPDTLYIADNPNPLAATKVWRFNYEGWGASNNGYTGPFTMGATFNQGFIADFITAGTLSADRIGANSIAVSKLTGKIINSNWEIDLENGTFTIGEISASKITSGTLDASDITVVNLNASNITTGTLNVLRIADNTLPGAKLVDLDVTPAKIANYSLSDLKISSGGISTWSTSSGINTSLAYADFSNDVFNNRDTAEYVNCKWANASRGFSAPTYYVEIDEETTGTVNRHTHYVTVSGNTITLGAPDFTGASHPFEKAASAADISLSLASTPAYYPYQNIYQATVVATLSGDSKRQTFNIDASRAYDAGYAAGAASASGISKIYITMISGNQVGVRAYHGSDSDYSFQWLSAGQYWDGYN